MDESKKDTAGNAEEVKQVATEAKAEVKTEKVEAPKEEKAETKKVEAPKEEKAETKKTNQNES